MLPRLGDVDVHVADAGLGRQSQPLCGAAHDDHLARAGELASAAAARPTCAALDQDRLAQPDRPTVVEGVHHRRTGTGQRHRSHLIDPRVESDDRGPRAQHDVLGPGPRKSRFLHRGAVHAVGAALLAQRRLPGHRRQGTQTPQAMEEAHITASPTRSRPAASTPVPGPSSCTTPRPSWPSTSGVGTARWPF